MNKMNLVSGYRYDDAELNPSHEYLLPAATCELERLAADFGAIRPRRLFDLGCGNGSIGAVLVKQGWEVTGVDPSPEGIVQAKHAHPNLQLEIGSAYDDLAAVYGQFPVVVSFEVVEHLYDPRKYASAVFSLLEPGGTAIISTPYHGYWKNLAMAFSGKMDGHFTALWDHGHIKFWSFATLSVLLTEAGLTPPRFLRVGRIQPFAKSMIAITSRPLE